MAGQRQGVEAPFSFQVLSDGVSFHYPSPPTCESIGYSFRCRGIRARIFSGRVNMSVARLRAILKFWRRACA